MKKKLYKNEEEINSLFIKKKLIKLKKQDYLSINLSIYVYICMYFHVYVHLVILTININISISRIFSLKSFVKNIYSSKFQKNLICAWKLSLNKGNYALKIDGGRQTDIQSLL